MKELTSLVAAAAFIALALIPPRRAKSVGAPYRCTSCSYRGFRSLNGKIVAGACPQGRCPCPLEPVH